MTDKTKVYKHVLACDFSAVNSFKTQIYMIQNLILHCVVEQIFHNLKYLKMMHDRFYKNILSRLCEKKM